MREFDSLGYLLESVLTGLEMGTRTREYLAMLLWADIVGESIARITSVQSARNGTLMVDVENSAWAQELQFCTPDLIQKVNRYLGSEAVKEIQFRVRTGLRKPGVKKPGPRAQPKRGKPAAIQLTLEECQDIESAAGGVQDEGLRAALTSTMASYRRMDRWMQIEGWVRCGGCQALHRPRRSCPFCGFQEKEKPRGRRK